MWRKKPERVNGPWRTREELPFREEALALRHVQVPYLPRRRAGALEKIHRENTKSKRPLPPPTRV